MRSANREGPQLSAPPPRSGRMSWAGLPLGRRAPSSPHYAVLIAVLLALMVFAALLEHKRELAGIAVVCGVVLPLALRWVWAVVLALIPVAVLSVTPLHSTKLAIIAIMMLGLAALVLFSAGLLRGRAPHLWVALLAALVLLAYLFPADPLVPWKVTLPTLIFTLGGLVVLAVSIASPPTTSALFGVILVTGAISGIVASAQREYLEGPAGGAGAEP